jgi:hypothetical protein
VRFGTQAHTVDVMAALKEREKITFMLKLSKSKTKTILSFMNFPIKTNPSRA